MKVGLGIVTYERPDYFKRSMSAVLKHLPGVVDEIAVYNDGSKNTEYLEIYEELPKSIQIIHPKKNKGVAVAKNWLLAELIDLDCDYLFLLEDDILVTSPRAVTEYMRVSSLSGIEHLMFAHHGPANEKGAMYNHNGVSLYPECIGAWCMYTKEVIQRVGYMDENLKNAWEHVEHTNRIAKAGYTTPFGMFADVTDSRDYLKEIPGSIENSSIRKRKDWSLNMAEGLAYWAEKDPNCPLVIK